MAIDPNGGVSWASYDSYGNPLASSDALGRTTAYSYTGNGGADAQHGQPTTVTDPNGVTTTNTYDATHRTLTQTSTPVILNRSDPSGKSFGLDTLVGTAVGAVGGFSAGAINSAATGIGARARSSPTLAKAR